MYLNFYTMAWSLNKVQIIGNMTADPEIRETPNGQKVATFSVATNRTWKDASWVKQEEVEFHNVSAWRGLADVIESYTSKWKKVYVEWYLKTRSWDDASGVKRWKTDIVAENIILLSSTGERTEYSAPAHMNDSAHSEEVKPRKAKAKIEEDITIEDIPF